MIATLSVGVEEEYLALSEGGNLRAVVDHLAVTPSTQQWPMAPHT